MELTSLKALNTDTAILKFLESNENFNLQNEINSRPV